MAPSSRRSSWREGLAVAITVAPQATANCTANWPTEPEPAWTSSTSPSVTPSERRAW